MNLFESIRLPIVFNLPPGAQHIHVVCLHRWVYDKRHSLLAPARYFKDTGHTPAASNDHTCAL